MHLIITMLFALLFGSLSFPQTDSKSNTGNVIFIHPDGTGLSGWHACRLLYYGPDGELNWDRLPGIGLYRGHTKNSITTSSQAGATMHAYGVKVDYDSYGLQQGEIITAASGNHMSIMQEAKSKGIYTGIINSGSIIEPGTGVFVASDPLREHYEAISKKIIQSGTDIILSGGEEWLLPEGFKGRHGAGKRKDGLNLISWAEQNGYKVVYNRDELLKVSAGVEKLLGVFAEGHTFNDIPEEILVQNNLQNYSPDAPTLAEMTKKAIDIFSNKEGNFMLVVEEEGTDNFGNCNNAGGYLEALKRADDAIGVVLKYIHQNPNTLIITASDSEAGGLEVLGDTEDKMNPDNPVPANDKNGAPIDGRNGTGSKPFISAPDKFGSRFPFEIHWSTKSDIYGSVVARAGGLNAEYVNGSFDNTDVYRVMYLTLFGKLLK